ncbi:MAG: hypothetical protein Q9187_002122 [Circinaria calcarea]
MDRASKRLRSLSTEDGDGDRDDDDWMTDSRGPGEIRPPTGNWEATRRTTASSSPATATTMPRPRRTVSGSTNPAVTVARSPSQSPDSTMKSIRLTVKMPSSKLREATSGGRRNASTNSRQRFEPAAIISGPRGSRAKRTIVDESGSDEDEDENEDEDDALPSEEEDEEEEDEEDDDDLEDAEGESDDVDADGDTSMQDAVPPPPPPVIRMTGPSSKPTLIVTPAQKGKVKSVEAKQMQGADEDDDEELSELESDGEANDEEGGEEDAEGEEVGDEDQDMDQDEEEVDTEGETPAAGSRASTPDVSKMTKRQRSRLDQVMGNDFLQLPMEPQTKKHLTEEEHAMRRAEMARRRKNLSEKRNEEEKMDTINRLLKKQAPKRRGKISAVELQAADHNNNSSTAAQEPEIEKPNPVFTRWISDSRGIRLGVPSEWEGTGVGRVFEGGKGGWVRRVVEEV